MIATSFLRLDELVPLGGAARIALGFASPARLRSDPAMQPLPNHICPLCGGANQCAPAKAGTLEVECWCTTASISPEALARVPAELVRKACLCPRCAAGVRGQPAPDA